MQRRIFLPSESTRYTIDNKTLTALPHSCFFNFVAAILVQTFYWKRETINPSAGFMPRGLQGHCHHRDRTSLRIRMPPGPWILYSEKMTHAQVGKHTPDHAPLCRQAPVFTLWFMVWFGVGMKPFANSIRDVAPNHCGHKKGRRRKASDIQMAYRGIWSGDNGCLRWDWIREWILNVD